MNILATISDRNSRSSTSRLRRVPRFLSGQPEQVAGRGATRHGSRRRAAHRRANGARYHRRMGPISGV